MGGDYVDPLGRLPHGRRGLKFDSGGHEEILVVSPPAWEAGIEMLQALLNVCQLTSPPAWEAGIEMSRAMWYSR